MLSSDNQPDALTTRLRRRVYSMGKIRAILRYHDFDDLKKINIGKCWVLIQPTLAMDKIGSSGTLYIERFGDRVYIE